jgi:hypothetical protein
MINIVNSLIVELYSLFYVAPFGVFGFFPVVEDSNRYSHL